MELLLEPSPAFQERLDAAPPGALVRLLPQEYPGPVVVRRPLTIDGQGATVWALSGPALAIDADRVRLRHLGVEATGGEPPDSPAGCALLVCAGRKPELEGVVVRGGVRGLIGEDGCWRLPDALHLGRLEPGEVYSWALRLYVPVPCRLVTAVAGLEVVPAELAAGANEVRLTLEALPPDTLLHGELNVISPHLTRRVAVVAHVLAGGPAERPDLAWGPSDWDELVARGAPAEPRELLLPPLPAPVALRPLPPAAPARPLPPPPTPVVPGAVPPVSAPAMPADPAAMSPLPPLPSPLLPATGSTPAGPRRKIGGPLVSNAFDAAADSAAAGEPAAPPATPAPSGRPAMKLKPLSRLFNQGAPPADAPAPEGEGPKQEG